MREPAATVKVYSSSSGKPNMGTVAMCVRDHVNAASFMSALTNDWSWLPPENGVMWLTVEGSMLVLQRNECLKQMEGDWILFIDDDMIWRPDQIGKLYQSWVEVQEQFDDPVIMGGLCHRRQEPFDPTLYMRADPTAGRYKYLETWDTDIVEVDATGLAFLLIPLSALERMTEAEWPDKETRMLYNPPQIFSWVHMGEDLRFCQDAKEAGCKIFVDTRIEIGHATEIQVTHKDYLQHIALRSKDDEEMVRAINDKYGLPTLSSEEARERLGWNHIDPIVGSRPVRSDGTTGTSESD